MKGNCHSSQPHPKEEGAKMKHFPNSKDDNYYMLSYTTDSFYNAKALTNSFTLSLEDMRTLTHLTVLHIMMLKALPF